MPFINDEVYDQGLDYADVNGTRIDLCSQEPTTYTEATSTYTLANKTGLNTGATQDASGSPSDGRSVVVPAITDGDVTGTGTATHWALTNGSSTLIATGALLASKAFTSGNKFSLDAIEITIFDAVDVGNAAETDAFLARCTGLSAAEIAAYELIINYLVDQNVFNKMHWLYWFATNNTTTAMLNLISTNYTGSLTIGSMNFTADVGFTGDASVGYIDTGFNPNTSASLNKLAIGAYVLSSRTTLDTGMPVGCSDATAWTTLGPRYNRAGGGLWANVNCNGDGPVHTNANAQGSTACYRIDSTNIITRRNESALNTTAFASNALPNQNMYAMAQNNNGSANNWVQDQVCAAWAGAPDDATDVDAIMHALNLGATSLGINTY